MPPVPKHEMKPDERRLLAVMIADVVGYSRLMGANEAETYTQIRNLQRSVFQPATATYRGAIVKWTGDGFIATFPNAVDAVRAAAEIQARLSASDNDSGDRIEVRIGVNLGDVILVSDDVYGDAVNIAARLQALAEPGGIVVSRSVMDSVKSGYGFSFESTGLQSVKNIAEPIDTHRVTFDIAGPWRSTADAAKIPTARPRSTWLIFAGVAGLITIALAAGFFITRPETSPPGDKDSKNAGTRSWTPAAAAIPDTDKAQENATDTGSSSASFTTSPQKEVRIGRSWQLDPKTCESRNVPELVITHAPVGGHLETRPVEFALRRSGSACTGHFVKGVDVVYVPNGTFAGLEKVSYRVMIGNRTLEREISITVK
jgi:class 3 adenylate cyclase